MPLLFWGGFYSRFPYFFLNLEKIGKLKKSVRSCHKRKNMRYWRHRRTKAVWSWQDGGERVTSGRIHKMMALFFCTGMLCLFPVLTVRAEEIQSDSRAIVAYTEDYTMGTVSSLCNGVSFQNCIYASNYDSIVVGAYPNSGYSFAYFTLLHATIWI